MRTTIHTNTRGLEPVDERCEFLHHSNRQTATTQAVDAAEIVLEQRRQAASSEDSLPLSAL
ncbi:MAG: hypothetical protein PW792_09585 [Acidobacteriaceae bacterium]|nr:hypothetical protein [Acidobacteriaceae bacterium]